MAAINPDVILFAEIETSVGDSELINRLNSVLPNGSDSWVIQRGIPSVNIQTVLASRYPLALQRTDTIPTSETRGVNIALVNLPNEVYEANLYMMGVHLKCCNSNGTEQERRQRAMDAIASWMGDARTEGGFIDLFVEGPMIALGDFNLVGGSNGNQPEQTLITGDIQDEVTFGPDIKGDWDNSDLTDLAPADPYTGNRNTWPSDTTNPSSRLDRFFFTDSVMKYFHGFVFNTQTMNNSQRASAGVQRFDTDGDTTADHLPTVMDVRLIAETGELNFDKQTYNCGSEFTLTLADPDQATAGTVIVSLSDESGHVAFFSLNEEATPGVFSRTLLLNDTNFPTLDLEDGVMVTAKYVDSLNVLELEEEVSASLILDCGMTSPMPERWAIY